MFKPTDIELWRSLADRYEQIHSGATYASRLPDLGSLRLSNNPVFGKYFLRVLMRDFVDVWPLDVYHFDGAYVSDLCYAFDKDKHCFPPSMVDNDAKHTFATLGGEGIEQMPFLDMNGIFIFKAGKNNFGHLLIEMLPKLELLEKVEIENPVLIVPTLPTRLFNELRDVVDRLYPSKYTFHQMTAPMMRVRNLIYPGPVARHGLVKSKVVVDFGARLLQHATRAPTIERLYVSRRGYKNRDIHNIDDVENIFVKHGFKVVNPDSFSFFEQAALFNSSKIIAGPQGAALANLLFCQEDSEVFMIDSGVADFFFWDICCIKNANLFWHIEKFQQFEVELVHAAFSVDLQRLESELVMFLDGK